MHAAQLLSRVRQLTKSMASSSSASTAVLLLCLSATHVLALDPARVLFLVRSSSYAEHERTLATELAAGLTSEGVPRANVRLLHEMKSKADYDNWCLLPWIQALAKEQQTDDAASYDWFFFAESNTRVDWQRLNDDVLRSRDAGDVRHRARRAAPSARGRDRRGLMRADAAPAA